MGLKKRRSERRRRGGEGDARRGGYLVDGGLVGGGGFGLHGAPARQQEDGAQERRWDRLPKGKMAGSARAFPPWQEQEGQGFFVARPSHGEGSLGLSASPPNSSCAQQVQFWLLFLLLVG